MHPLRYARAGSIYEDGSNRVYALVNKNEGICEVPVRRSVQPNYVVCLDCGFRAVTLRRHIRVRHGLRPDEYQQRWGLKINHPLTAPAYSRRRATVAKAIGLGRKPSLETIPVPTPTAAPLPVSAEPA